MNFIKTVVLALTLITSTATFAIGGEELCYRKAETDVVAKQLLQKYPSALQHLIGTIEKSDNTPEAKADFVERLYWTYNRKDLSDDLLRKLSLLRCMTQQ